VVETVYVNMVKENMTVKIVEEVLIVNTENKKDIVKHVEDRHYANLCGVKQ
jgi:hypothetical protein